MEYTKPPLSYENQADLLIQRGLIANRDILIQRLNSVNYYRLSGYLYPYRLPNDNYQPGTTFEDVWCHYTFDRRLRFIVMDAIERIEISVRTQLIYTLAFDSGPFGYLKPEGLPNLKPEKHTQILEELEKELLRSKETFVAHFKHKYGDAHAYPPLWIAGEIISFGCMLTMYKGTAPAIKRKIAGYYKIPDEVLNSWLLTLNMIRNICAHHGRLWNRVLGNKPKLPNEHKYPEWHKPVLIPNNRVFVVLSMMKYMLSTIAPQSGWTSRLLLLLNEYPKIDLSSMGFPENWKESPIWKENFS